MTSSQQLGPRDSFRAGLRAGIPFAMAGGLLSLTFGLFAREVGFSALGAIVMSAIVFADSAQFAVVSILAIGADTAGVLAAEIVLARGASILVGVGLAVAVTALLRGLG